MNRAHAARRRRRRRPAYRCLPGEPLRHPIQWHTERGPLPDNAGTRQRQAAAPRPRPPMNHSPPLCPSPNHWNPAGKPWIQAPPVAQRMASRSTTMAASVTTMDGSRRRATSAPVSDPSSAPHATSANADQRHGSTGLGSHTRHDAADCKLGADRDIDLADQDHHGHADSSDQHRDVRERRRRADCPSERTRAPPRPAKTNRHAKQCK